MKKDGLVLIERDKKNRRNVNVYITDKGRAVLDQATPVAQEAVDQVMLSMTDNDIPQLQKMITLMRNNAHDGLNKITR